MQVVFISQPRCVLYTQEPFSNTTKETHEPKHVPEPGCNLLTCIWKRTRKNDTIVWGTSIGQQRVPNSGYSAIVETGGSQAQTIPNRAFAGSPNSNQDQSQDGNFPENSIGFRQDSKGTARRQDGAYGDPKKFTSSRNAMQKLCSDMRGNRLIGIGLHHNLQRISVARSPIVPGVDDEFDGGQPGIIGTLGYNVGQETACVVAGNETRFRFGILVPNVIQNSQNLGELAKR
ncbi:hypothetical protein B0H13DRAFT_1924602 [Mycena leptocephala]|nr:hypothetical protein B0H13DRAFT_1924602 [Mycena leptocephala]